MNYADVLGVVVEDEQGLGMGLQQSCTNKPHSPPENNTQQQPSPLRLFCVGCCYCRVLPITFAAKLIFLVER